MDHDFAVVGELHGVGDEIDENLAEPRGIGGDDGRQAGRGLDPEADLLFPGAGGEEGDGGLDAIGENEGRVLDLKPVSLDLGEIEHVVDDGEEVVAALADGFHALALLGIERGGAEEGGHADDGIHRCANLVAHRGEKLGLGARGLLGDAAGMIELTAGALEIGDDDILALDEAAQLEGVYDVTLQRGERLQLAGSQLTGFAIGDAERAERPAIVRDERRAGIEADIGVFEDGGVIVETRVRLRIGHDEKILVRLADDVGAQGGLTRAFGTRDADLGLEPLALGVDECDERDGRPADLGGELRDLVVVGLGRRIQNAERTEHGYAFGIVGGNGRGQHRRARRMWFCE